MVTIKDVARDAGVAVGTVSKVLNGQYVKEANRIRVEESVRKLNYEMNYYARGMKMGNSSTIAVIIPDVLNPFFSHWVYELEKEISSRNYKMLLCQTDGDAEKEGLYFKMASQNRVDGIIGITYNDTDAYMSGDFPFVSLDRHFATTVCCVASDNMEGGRIAARKLVEGGCSRLIYIRSGSNQSGETLKRWDGFEEGCRQLGYEAVQFDLGNEKNAGDGWQVFRERIYEFLKNQMTDGKLSYDGIFVSTDVLARVVIEQLNRLGLDAPDDVQVIGYDGIKAYQADRYWVSTIVQPIADMARTAVEMLLLEISGEEVPVMNILPVTFAYGGTTKERT